MLQEAGAGPTASELTLNASGVHPSGSSSMFGEILLASTRLKYVVPVTVSIDLEKFGDQSEEEVVKVSDQQERRGSRL